VREKKDDPWELGKRGTWTASTGRKKKNISTPLGGKRPIRSFLLKKDLKSNWRSCAKVRRYGRGKEKRIPARYSWRSYGRERKQ